MRRTKASNPRPGESQDAAKPKSPPPRRFKSRWELEQERVIQRLRAAGWKDRAILEQLQTFAIMDWDSLVKLACRGGPFKLYSRIQYLEFGL